jgi:dGTP triphosphohydrolase
MFPRPYQEELDRVEGVGLDVDAQKIRTAVDFIASMTEQQALRVYERVTGHGPGSILAPY